MGYTLYSEDGFVCDVASINGYSELVDFIGTFTGKNYIKSLLSKGKTTYIKETIKDIDSLLSGVSKLSIKTTLQGLKEGLSKIKEVAVISE